MSALEASALEASVLEASVLEGTAASRALRLWLAQSLLAVAFLAPPTAAQSSGASGKVSGHLKTQVLSALYSEESVFDQLFGSASFDENLDLRLNLSARKGKWDFAADLQIAALYGDSIEALSSLGVGPLLRGPFPEDDLRLFDFTKVQREGQRGAWLTRLDRFSVGYTGSKAVLRLGRQAVTWGNGFVFTPMDIFNPFDPTAIDKEYKAGDDMIYGQWLRDRGDDLQAVVVARRDPTTGEVEQDRGSAALKYHQFWGAGEVDFLVAEHYDQTLLGVGGNRSLGGAVVRADVVATEIGDSWTTQAVANLSYSWVAAGKNMNGLLEAFYNGFGQSGGRYSPSDLTSNQELLERVDRGELFNLGRLYAAASVTIEVTPLFLVTPNVFWNLEDPSALFQLVWQNDLQQDLVLQGAISVPVGPSGSEYGGIEAGLDRFLSNDASLFLQLAWYF